MYVMTGCMVCSACVPGSRWAQWGDVGWPPEDGESRLPSSEGFLADDLGPEVNLQPAKRVALSCCS